MDFHIIRILILSSASFILAFFITPLVTHFLFKYKMGKSIRKTGSTPVFSELHAKKAGTPTMGGIIIWGTTLVLTLAFSLLSQIFDNEIFEKMNFLSRGETLMPLGILVLSALVGLFDDWLDIRRAEHGGGGLTVKFRLLIYTIIAGIGAWWFYFKLAWDTFHVPFVGTFQLGWPYLVIFIFIIVATAFSVNETDGLDGLAGGTLMYSFMAYGVITFLRGQYDLATFCGVIVGALLAFLWFNINPARFFMGDTGAMSLGVTLGIVAMFTNTQLILPLIGSIFVIESASVLIQLTSKKLRGKKVFISSPIHHHFEAIGWSEPKIVMRFWVIAQVSAAIGLVIFLLDKSL
jgi:phospho-N-acetylmuramoyl-pentapeptide-transferase